MRKGIYFDLVPESLESCFGMTSELMMFLSKHAECAHCGEIANEFSDHMNCGFQIVRGKRRSLPARLFVHGKYADTLYELRSKENIKRKTFQRKQRVRAAQGEYTREEILTLRQLQEDKCFYCFATLLGPSLQVNYPGDPVTCHIDHFVSLLDGGTNYISNVVLACPRCNDRKGVSDGIDFMLYGVGALNRQDRVGLRRIHRNRQKHRYKLALPPRLACLEFEIWRN
jgi:5-methylcytosine-specific restriction endonuclease McrA